jgi:hypothetical protein
VIGIYVGIRDMFVRFTEKGLLNMIKDYSSDEALGIKYDCGLHHFEIIDEKLFFLAVIAHELEFSEIYHESRRWKPIDL